MPVAVFCSKRIKPSGRKLNISYPVNNAHIPLLDSCINFQAVYVSGHFNYGINIRAVEGINYACFNQNILKICVVREGLQNLTNSLIGIHLVCVSLIFTKISIDQPITNFF